MDKRKQALVHQFEVTQTLASSRKAGVAGVGVVGVCRKAKTGVGVGREVARSGCLLPKNASTVLDDLDEEESDVLQGVGRDVALRVRESLFPEEQLHGIVAVFTRICDELQQFAYRGLLHTLHLLQTFASHMTSALLLVVLRGGTQSGIVARLAVFSGSVDSVAAFRGKLLLIRRKLLLLLLLKKGLVLLLFKPL